MKFKKGDKVRIKEGPKKGDSHCSWDVSMEKMIGKEYILEGQFWGNWGIKDEYGSSWGLLDEWLEKVEESSYLSKFLNKWSS